MRVSQRSALAPHLTTDQDGSGDTQTRPSDLAMPGLTHVVLLEREYGLPVILHADDGPTLLLCLVIKRLREGADLGTGQPCDRAVRIFAPRVVVQHEHRESRAAAGCRVF